MSKTTRILKWINWLNLFNRTNDETGKDFLIKKNRKNPIVNLLNGDVMVCRKNVSVDDEEMISDDLQYNRIEIFREVNIQMLTSRNIYDGLELEWGETSIDAMPNNSSKDLAKVIIYKIFRRNIFFFNSCLSWNFKSLYEQESWIIQLPAVLFICLNRYKFVKATQSSSKILEPFEFYPSIYLDRFMHKNKEMVKLKRKHLKILKNDLKQLEDQLNT